MLPIMILMRSRLRSVTIAVAAAILTVGVGVAHADSVAVNGGATYLSSTSEMLNGLVNTTDPDSAYGFQYGTTPNFGQYTKTATVGAGTTVVAATVTGLTPGTKYYFRLVVVGFCSTSSQTDLANCSHLSDTLTFVAGSNPGGNGGGGNGGGGGKGSGKGSLATRKLKVKHGSVAIAVKCTGAAGSTCSGRLAVTAKGKLPHHKHAHTYKCGSGSFNATAGNAGVVHGKLSKGCAALLASKSNHKLHGTAHVTFTSKQSPLTKSVTLSG
jgi:hypothetical protein